MRDLTSTFQSTRPRGARPHSSVPSHHASLFQSTRPRGARPRRVCSSETLNEFQSTRPRGTRLGAVGRFGHVRHVSIHAPAWGATLFELRARRLLVVSIHAPAWGATIGDSGRECDCLVSIHAPAWGATGHIGRAKLLLFWFQSTRPRGARQLTLAVILTALGFQSTRPRGARLPGCECTWYS